MADETKNNVSTECSLATSRSRRSKPDSRGRGVALEKLKKGKNKYEVQEIKNVYEYVDDKEYSRRRRDRVEEDWIVDDDGGGYTEDGREIFDDEDDDEMFTSKKTGQTKGSSKNKEERQTGKGSIKNMLINMPTKKRKAESDVALEDDELLDCILLDLGSKSPAFSKPSVTKRSRQSESPQPDRLKNSFSSPINPFAMNKGSTDTITPIRPTISKDTTEISGRNTILRKNLKRLSAVDKDSTNGQPVTKSGDENIGSALQKNNIPNDMEFDIATTPVRSVSLLPRSVLRENVSDELKTSPKAKRALAEAKTEVAMETEEDLVNMDFSALADDDDPFDDVDLNETKDSQKIGETSKPTSCDGSEASSKSELKPAVHRGFAASDKTRCEDAIPSADLWEGEVSFASGQDQTPTLEVAVDAGTLPLVHSDEGKQILRFYWLDAFEDQYKQPGTVFIFGKVWVENAKAFTSCCLTVKNIPRRVYLLPRTKRINPRTNEVICDVVTMKDVYDEFNEKVTKKLGVKEFKSRSVKKKYAFDKLEIPNEADYLEVRYSAEHHALPMDANGETFSHVFGQTCTALELLLIEKRIKGPCWLDVSAAQQTKPPLSWCKVEASINNPSYLRVTAGDRGCAPPPPVVTLTLTMRTTLNPKTHQSEVAAVGCLVHKAFPLDKPPPQPPYTDHFCVLTKPVDVIWPYDFKHQLPRYKHTKLEKIDSERGLLGWLLAKIQQIDPDVIVGHDLLGYDLGILLHRISSSKIPHWSRLGRLRRTLMPKLSGRSGFAEKSALAGRLICDIKLSAKELIRARSYELGALAAQVLRVSSSSDGDDAALDPHQVKKMYESSSSLMQLVSLTMQNSFHVVRLLCELSVLPLALQITNIAGNVFSRTLLGGRSERNEFLLLHAFAERDYIVPDRDFAKSKTAPKETDDVDDEGNTTVVAPSSTGRKKAAYIGGLVLEPKKGFYDKFILLMDFNSLYPSIIQEYNICFTTIDRQRAAASLKQSDGSDAPLELPEPDQAPGVLPTEIRKLVESRRSVKTLMKASDLSCDAKMQLDIRQKALKLTANSMYGCLGFSHSRFYAAHLAAMVTGKGREILLHTRDLVQKLNFEVIYGDTDSIMINTNCTDYDQVFKLGNKIKQEVNKLYRQLELDVDGVYKYMLLLKKKKYAAMAMTRLPSGRVIAEPELKGLDIVRRDWSQLAANAGRLVLDQILSEQSPDERVGNIHSLLEELASKLREGQVELSKLVITKQLTKRPDDYPDKAALPHVQVALRLNAAGAKTLKQGDTVPYVICKDGTSNSSSQRAYHPEELKKNTELSIDTEYYLAHQLHPVVARLCDPIEGSDAARIAECLGLDPGHYRSSPQYQDRNGDADDMDHLCRTELSAEERYRGCQRFSFKCTSGNCDTLITLDNPFRQGANSEMEPVLQCCPNPKCGHKLYSNLAPLRNALTLTIRRHIQQYYEGWLVCEDPGCINRTRRVPLRFVRGFPVCNVCMKGVLIREYTESQLYKQLCFYDYVFDFQKACIANKNDRIKDDGLRQAYASMHAEVQKFLDMSAYSQVNLAGLFANLYPNTKA